MTNPDDGAFPLIAKDSRMNDWYIHGLTKREYFASKSDPTWNAVQEFMAREGYEKPSLEEKLAMRARIRVMEADALIVELNK